MKPVLSGVFTSGIGSLPHHNVDSALAYSFGHTIPYLPQIPMRNPWEFMIPCALEGMPGIDVGSGGSARLNMDVWSERVKAFTEKTQTAFEYSEKPGAFEYFEPSAAASSSWQPFLWELSERKTKTAKIQIAGPLSCQMALSLSDGGRADHHSELATLIVRLVLARSIAMVRAIQKRGIQTVLFMDEPAFYVFDPNEPRHQIAIRELKFMVQALKREKALVGLHCCGNTNWRSILELGLDVLSFDAGLSMESILKEKDAVEKFHSEGGVFSMGVIPSGAQGEALRALDAQELKSELAAGEHFKNSILTPACGLALHSVEDAEYIRTLLQAFAASVDENL